MLDTVVARNWIVESDRLRVKLFSSLKNCQTRLAADYGRSACLVPLYPMLVTLEFVTNFMGVLIEEGLNMYCTVCYIRAKIYENDCITIWGATGSILFLHGLSKFWNTIYWRVLPTTMLAL